MSMLWLASSSQEAAQSKAVSSEAQLLGGRSTLSGLYGRANRADRVFFWGVGDRGAGWEGSELKTYKVWRNFLKKKLF